MDSIFGSTEIVQIADAVAREKNIDREDILGAMEQAIQVAGRRKYGQENNISAVIDRKSGKISLYKVTEVVEEIEDEHKEILLVDAKKIDDSLEIGSLIKEPLPPIDFGRIAAQTAKQVIMQKVRDAEREKQYEEFKDKLGQVASGVVKSVERGNVIAEFNRTEVMIRQDELIPREIFRAGDRIRAYIADVNPEKHNSILLSRSHNKFLAKLFEQEVPEIYDGVVEIQAVARDPGSRAKIAVSSRDASVNPVLSCVGVRGSRVQAVVSELQGEKIDIVEYSADPATFIINALSSADVSKVVIDEDEGKVDIIVPEEQLSIAIGRRGQNVRLASQLTGWKIDIMTEEEESTKRAEEFNKTSAMFVESLNIEEVMAQLLTSEGFSTIEDVAYVELPELATIEGFDEDVAAALQERAKEWIEAKSDEIMKRLKKRKVEDALINLEGIDLETIDKLSENEIITLDDFADLSVDEFFDIIPDSQVKKSEVSEMIMKAREHWFDDEEKAAN